MADFKPDYQRELSVRRPERMSGAISHPDDDESWSAAEQDDLAAAGLLHYWRILVRRKWMIAAFTAAGVVAGFLITIPSPFLFEAKTLVEVQDFNQNFMGLAQVDPRAGNYSPTEVNIATELHMLKSGDLQWRVLERLNRELPPSTLPELPGIVARVRRYAQDVLRRTPKDPLVAMRRALARASSTLEVGVLQGTRLVEVRCRSTMPEVAAAFANAMAVEYMNQNLEQRVASLQRSSQWFTTQLQDMKTKLEQSQERLHALRSNGGGGAGTQPAPQSLAATQAASLQQQVAAAQAERISREAQLQTLTASNSDTLLDSVALAPYRTKVEEARRTLTTLNTTLTPAHYKVKRAESDLAEAEATLVRERDALVAKLRAELENVRERERLVSAAYSGQLRAMSAQSEAGLEASLLEQEVQTTRQQYQLMLQQASQAAVASAVPANHIRIVERAGPQNEPVNLFESRAMAMGGVTGLLLSIAIAVSLHQLNRSVQGPGHASRLLGVRELGVVFSGNSRVAQVSIKPGAPRGLLTSAGTVEQIGVDGNPTLFAESFRAILASILLPYRMRVPQVIVISSPEMKEGKSTVSSNLATALADLNRRVLLIDADLRRPRQHGIFGVDNQFGLASLLMGGERPGQPGHNELGVKVAGRENLRVLPAGPAPENAGALLYSPRLGQLITRLRSHFDHILIDTPPLVRFPDARLLGTLSDGVVLVLRSGVTDVERAVAARELLARDGTRVIGAILNDWAPKKRDADQYRQYQNYYMQAD